jgi:hypothetical protein
MCYCWLTYWLESKFIHWVNCAKLLIIACIEKVARMLFRCSEFDLHRKDYWDTLYQALLFDTSRKYKFDHTNSDCDARNLICYGETCPSSDSESATYMLCWPVMSCLLLSLAFEIVTINLMMPELVNIIVLSKIYYASLSSNQLPWNDGTI